jgi:hypothetical protein
MPANSDDPLYSRFVNMKRRCYNVQDPSFVHYGLTGIGVYEPWLDPDSGFELFAKYIYRYLGPKPYPDYSLDRINPRGNYEPRNLRWADAVTQANNQRTREQIIAAWWGAFYCGDPVHVELAKRMLKKSKYVPRSDKERLDNGGRSLKPDPSLDKPRGRQSKKHFYLSLPFIIHWIFSQPVQLCLPVR